MTKLYFLFLGLLLISCDNCFVNNSKKTAVHEQAQQEQDAKAKVKLAKKLAKMQQKLQEDDEKNKQELAENNKDIQQKAIDFRIKQELDVFASIDFSNQNTRVKTRQKLEELFFKKVISKNGELLLTQESKDYISVFLADTNDKIKDIAEEVLTKNFKKLISDDKNEQLLDDLNKSLIFNKNIKLGRLYRFYKDNLTSNLEKDIFSFADRDKNGFGNDKEKDYFSLLFLLKAATDKESKELIEKNNDFYNMLKQGLELAKKDDYFSKEQLQQINNYAQKVGLDK